MTAAAGNTTWPSGSAGRRPCERRCPCWGRVKHNWKRSVSARKSRAPLARRTRLTRKTVAPILSTLTSKQGASETVHHGSRLHEKCSDARRATKVVLDIRSRGAQRRRWAFFRANPEGRGLAGDLLCRAAWHRRMTTTCAALRASHPAKPLRGPCGTVSEVP